MKRIPLTQGKYAIIDEVDYGIVSLFKWCAGKFDNTFYAMSAYTDIDGKRKTLMMHRLIGNAPTGKQIDHINHDGLDNRKSNLRICNQHQNLMNRHIAGGTSQYKGVCWHKKNEHWQAYITVNYKNIYLGCKSNEHDAAQLYNDAAIKYYGTFAHLNKINS